MAGRRDFVGRRFGGILVCNNRYYFDIDLGYFRKWGGDKCLGWVIEGYAFFSGIAGLLLLKLA